WDGQKQLRADQRGRQDVRTAERQSHNSPDVNMSKGFRDMVGSLTQDQQSFPPFSERTKGNWNELLSAIHKNSLQTTGLNCCILL
ncbi:hypothetical protein DPEC_G00255230, partial [Dallia pectoralis]